MIEITAKLPQRSVFLAGETIECLVTVTNVIRSGLKANGSISSSGKLKVAKLAWVSAQIHCQCSVSENRVVLPADSTQINASDIAVSSSETTFVPFKGEKGSTVLATKPMILVCDLTLNPGESQTFMYSETLPVEAPPSYRGVTLKYSYKITIGAQRFASPTKLLRLPFRVLVVPGLADMSVYESVETEGTFKPSNPFHEDPKMENSLLDIALENLQIITCRKGPSLYNITNSQGKVAEFCLYKQAYRIGDDIIGSFDFSSASVPCVQFSVTLQSEEQISESCQQNATSPSSQTNNSSSLSSSVTSYSRHEEFCLSTIQTHISISIPLTATPTFTTDLVTVRWRLHFEFMTSKTCLPRLSAPSNSDSDSVWQGPGSVDVETMVWDLPIKVFASNPAFVSSVSQLRTDATCVL